MSNFLLNEYEWMNEWMSMRTNIGLTFWDIFSILICLNAVSPVILTSYVAADCFNITNCIKSFCTAEEMSRRSASMWVLLLGTVTTRNVAIVNAFPLEVARCRASCFALYTCTQTAVSELVIKLVTWPLDWATPCVLNKSRRLCNRLHLNLKVCSITWSNALPNIKLLEESATVNLGHNFR